MPPGNWNLWPLSYVFSTSDALRKEGHPRRQRDETRFQLLPRSKTAKEVVSSVVRRIGDIVDTQEVLAVVPERIPSIGVEICVGQGLSTGHCDAGEQEGDRAQSESA